MVGRAGQTAIPISAGMRAFNMASLAAVLQPPAPPIQREIGESTLERQTRAGPSATPPVISDGEFNKCAICLGNFVNQDKVWRLQCGHVLHAQYWGRVAHAHMDR
eukprot:9028356-Pyramimonas_sp.AAC.1